MNTVLYVLAECIRQLAILTQPFMPEASMKLLDQLAIANDERCFDAITEENRGLKPGIALPKPEGIFPRFTKEESKE